MMLHDAIKTMLKSYNPKSLSEMENALKEIVQEIALLGLWRGKFFEQAAFMVGQLCAFYMALIDFLKIWILHF